MGFYVQEDFWMAVEDLPIKQQDEIIGALTRLFYTGEDTELKGVSKVAYVMARDRVLIARKRSAAGKSKAETNDNQNAEQNANQTANQTANQNDNQNASDLLKSESESKSKSENLINGGRFSPPTPEDVAAYAAEKGLCIDSHRFCDYYTSKGWMVGKVKMKDWRSAVRNWCRNNYGRGGVLDADAKRYAAAV